MKYVDFEILPTIGKTDFAKVTKVSFFGLRRRVIHLFRPESDYLWLSMEDGSEVVGMSRLQLISRSEKFLEDGK